MKKKNLKVLKNLCLPTMVFDSGRFRLNFTSSLLLLSMRSEPPRPRPPPLFFFLRLFLFVCFFPPSCSVCYQHLMQPTNHLRLPPAERRSSPKGTPSSRQSVSLSLTFSMKSALCPTPLLHHHHLPGATYWREGTMGKKGGWGGGVRLHKKQLYSFKRCLKVKKIIMKR